MRVRVVGLLILAALLGRPAAAQEAGDVGITMGYPAGVGVVWHVTDGIALRPDVSVNWTSSESESTTGGLLPGLPPRTTTSSADSWTTAVGLSALFYVRTIDRLRLYVAPRGAYLRSSVDLEDGLGVASTFDTTTDGYLASGSFGAQFSVHDHFALVGELGLQYTSQSASASFLSSRSETESRTAGLRSAVGVTLYF